MYHHSYNSIVERKNRSIENYLLNYANSSHKDWDKYLPFCLIYLNSSYNTSIGNTPHSYVKLLPYSIPDYVSPFVNNKS